MEQLLKLSQQASHSQRVVAVLEHLLQTIERHEPQSETNTYRLFDRLADKLVVAHPEILVTHNLVNKLKKLIHERLEEETDDGPAARKKDRPNLKELFADLSLTAQPSTTVEQQEEEEPRRVKIATLEELNNCMEDLGLLYK